jgi:hypothetical protein
MLNTIGLHNGIYRINKRRVALRGEPKRSETKGKKISGETVDSNGSKLKRITLYGLEQRHFCMKRVGGNNKENKKKSLKNE